MTIEQQRRRACRRFGWTSLLAWALFGLALETLHGWKVGPYLDDALARELLVLGHAHGVGLAIVVLAFGEAGAPLFGRDGDGGASLLLRIGAVLVPAAFALSAIDHPEGDPNLLVWLVPLGAAAILAGLARTAYAAWRA